MDEHHEPTYSKRCDKVGDLEVYLADHIKPGDRAAPDDFVCPQKTTGIDENQMAYVHCSLTKTICMPYTLLAQKVRDDKPRKWWAVY